MDVINSQPLWLVGTRKRHVCFYDLTAGCLGREINHIKHFTSDVDLYDINLCLTYLGRLCSKPVTYPGADVLKAS